jgi:enhancer of mRNA-decapping protein 3
MNVEVSRNGNDMDGNVKRGKGWRQTPLLQPSPQTTSPQSKSTMKKTRREQQEEKEEQRNGWATEDATDIQDLGDFDFEANHKLFDKKQVFDQLRQGDTTADEDRLVSHNKLPRPGTYGGKNLHPTENVLSPQLAPKYNSNELDSTSDADTELNLANGRSSSRHSSSRVAMKKQPSRQNSAQVEPKPHPLSASMSSDHVMSRAAHSLSGRPGRTVPSIGNSPMPDRTHSPHSAISTTKSHATPLLTSQQIEPHLGLSPGLTPCPVLLPTALETLEKETVARYGLTHDAITESAARCIAETAMHILESSTTSRRGSRANTLQRGMSTSGLGIDRSSPPVIVIIAGNHAIGARALAAARHLVCRKTKIIIAEAAYEAPETQDTQTKTQLAILKRMVKAGASIKRGPWRRASGYIKNLPSPPALIIDALLSGATYESLLDSSNAEHAAASQQETREMIGWANRSRAPVLSIACPSGVSGIDGSTTTFEGEPLAVRPDKLLCLAAPMQGILSAMKGGERWEVSLADVGVNIALRSDEAVAFGAQWVVEVRFVEGEGQGVEQQ